MSRSSRSSRRHAVTPSRSSRRHARHARHVYRCVLQNRKCWPLRERIPRKSSQRWLYGLRCVTDGYENSRYIGDGGVQSTGALLITRLADIC